MVLCTCVYMCVYVYMCIYIYLSMHMSMSMPGGGMRVLRCGSDGVGWWGVWGIGGVGGRQLLTVEG